MIGLAFRRMIRCEWSPFPPRGSLPPRVPQRIAPCLRRGDGLDRPHALGVRGDLKSVPVRASAEVARLVVPRTGCLGHPRLRWRGRRGQPSAEDVHERVVRVRLRRLAQIARAGARVAAVDAWGRERPKPWHRREGGEKSPAGGAVQPRPCSPAAVSCDARVAATGPGISRRHSSALSSGPLSERTARPRPAPPLHLAHSRGTHPLPNTRLVCRRRGQTPAAADTIAAAAPRRSLRSQPISRGMDSAST
mmetsp:Transcript_31616/g.104621  ORF Transcript_31616/g.104621 Transcript_31616/m.104621 type:complete len:249 (+) Transcript_31616:80-826(+)